MIAKMLAYRTDACSIVPSSCPISRSISNANITRELNQVYLIRYWWGFDEKSRYDARRMERCESELAQTFPLYLQCAEQRDGLVAREYVEIVLATLQGIWSYLNRILGFG